MSGSGRDSLRPGRASPSPKRTATAHPARCTIRRPGSSFPPPNASTRHGHGERRTAPSSTASAPPVDPPPARRSRRPRVYPKRCTVLLGYRTIRDLPDTTTYLTHQALNIAHCRVAVWPRAVPIRAVFLSGLINRHQPGTSQVEQSQVL